MGTILALLSILTIGYGITEAMTSVGMPRKPITKATAYGSLVIGAFWIFTILWLYLF